MRKMACLLLVALVHTACEGADLPEEFGPPPAGDEQKPEGPRNVADGVDEEDGPAIFDLIGDGDVLVVRGRGLEGARAHLEQVGMRSNLAILSGADHELRLALPTVAAPGSAKLVVEVEGVELRRELVLLHGASGGQGEKGEAGPMGMQGEEGPQGPVGPQGPQGPQGPVGPQGPEGPAGPAGPKGENGLQGPRGDQGEKGSPGQDGKDGAPGPKGDRGPQGESGIVGVDFFHMGSGNKSITASASSWTSIGTRTVTVTRPSTLLLFADVGGADPVVSSVPGAPFEYRLTVDGHLVPGSTILERDGRRGFFFTTHRVSAGNHTIEVRARCSSSLLCYSGSIDRTQQRVLVVQAGD